MKRRLKEMFCEAIAFTLWFSLPAGVICGLAMHFDKGPKAATGLEHGCAVFVVMTFITIVAVIFAPRPSRDGGKEGK